MVMGDQGGTQGGPLKGGRKEDRDSKEDPMNIDGFLEVTPKKRSKHNTTSQENTIPSTPSKKPLKTNVIRRTTKQLRMDYPTAKTRKEAYEKWRKIVQMIRKIDPTAIIHGRNKQGQILNQDKLPEANEAHNYTTINTIKKLVTMMRHMPASRR